MKDFEPPQQTVNATRPSFDRDRLAGRGLLQRGRKFRLSIAFFRRVNNGKKERDTFGQRCV
jgi:hypothetical protein